MRAINGPASEKGNPKNEFVFRYELQSEVTSLLRTPPTATNLSQEGWLYDASVAANLHNLRVTMRWPVFEQGATWGVGRDRRTVRGIMNGMVSRLAPRTNYFLVDPNIYTYVSAQ